MEAQDPIKTENYCINNIKILNLTKLIKYACDINIIIYFQRELHEQHV